MNRRIDPINKDFAIALKCKRKLIGKSLSRLVGDTGFSKPTLCYYEKVGVAGKLPGPRLLAQIARGYYISEVQLLKLAGYLQGYKIKEDKGLIEYIKRFKKHSKLIKVANEEENRLFEDLFLSFFGNKIRYVKNVGVGKKYELVE